MQSKWLCWYSTEESRAAGKVSVLAVCETILSVAAYWWIAVAFNTYVHLFVSILVAPLVLLRSEASIVLGFEMFRRYDIGDGNNWKRSTLVLNALLCAACSSLVVWFPAESWLLGHSGWALFWRVAVLGWFALNIGIGGAIAVGGRKAVPPGVAGAVAGAIVGAVAVAGEGAVAGAGASAVAVVLLVVVAAGVATVIARPGAEAGMLAVETAVIATVTGVGVSIGFLTRTLLIRFWATVTHLFAGVRALPINWQVLTARTDARQPPELIPSLPREHTLRFEKLITHWRSGGRGKLFFIIVSPIFYLPSLIYRYSLKSTAWLYLPLIYIAYLPAKLQGAKGLR